MKTRIQLVVEQLIQSDQERLAKIASIVAGQFPVIFLKACIVLEEKQKRKNGSLSSIQMVDLRDHVKRLILDDHFVAAVKYVREKTGMTLGEAKNFADKIKFEMGHG